MKNFFTIFEEYLDEIKHLLLSKLLLKLKSLVFLLPTACIVLINTEQHVAAKHNHLHIAFKAREKLFCGMYNLQCKQQLRCRNFLLQKYTNTHASGNITAISAFIAATINKQARR